MLDNMHDYRGVSLLQDPWGERSELTAYEEACAMCEVRVRLTTEEQRNAVARNLRYDKRKNGARGRALVAHVPELGLVVGDRLEPSLALMNVADFDTAELPLVATFWRRRMQGSRCADAVLHRNPHVPPRARHFPSAVVRNRPPSH